MTFQWVFYNQCNELTRWLSNEYPTWLSTPHLSIQILLDFSRSRIHEKLHLACLCNEHLAQSLMSFSIQPLDVSNVRCNFPTKPSPVSSNYFAHRPPVNILCQLALNFLHVVQQTSLGFQWTSWKKIFSGARMRMARTCPPRLTRSSSLAVGSVNKQQLYVFTFVGCSRHCQHLRRDGLNVSTRPAPLLHKEAGVLPSSMAARWLLELRPTCVLFKD